jgi:hypothetical protein
MPLAGAGVFLAVFGGELFQLVFCDGFFEVHKIYGAATSGKPPASLLSSEAIALSGITVRGWLFNM